MDDIENMLRAWEHLGMRERKVLLAFAWRLLAGQKRHGKLSYDKKDWNYEAIEEALDASVYLTALLNDRSEKAFRTAVQDAEEQMLRENGRFNGSYWEQY